MEQFGKYELIGRLGVGGMAEVFLARQTGPAGFKKQLVIKRILSSYADDEKFITMFLDEARLVARLHHPNIVQIFELGQIDGRYYIAMEYVKGKSVSQIITQHSELDLQIPLNYAAKLVSEICNGLEYAHRFTDEDGTAFNLVHRDVTPENALVSFDGPVKVIDFGVAKARSNLFKTQAGAIKGKLSYMSPEQIRGKSLDLRSDIFSLGIVLFELCTGKGLFGGDIDLSAVSDILSQPPKRPEDFVYNFPTRLTEIIFRALEKDPDDRYPSAGEMQVDLEEFIHSYGKYVTVAAIGDYVRRLFSDNPEDREHLHSLLSQSQEYASLQMHRGPELTPSPPRMSVSQSGPPRPPASLPGLRATPPGAQPPVEQTVSLDVTTPPTPLSPTPVPPPSNSVQGFDTSPFKGPDSSIGTSAASTPSMPVASTPASSIPAMPVGASQSYASSSVAAPPAKSGGALKWIFLVIILLAGGGAGGYFTYNYIVAKKKTPSNKPNVSMTDTDSSADMTLASADLGAPTLPDIVAPVLPDVTTLTQQLDVSVPLPTLDVSVPLPQDDVTTLTQTLDVSGPGPVDPNHDNGGGGIPDTVEQSPDTNPGTNFGPPDVETPPTTPDVEAPTPDVEAPTTPDAAEPPNQLKAPPGMALVLITTTPPVQIRVLGRDRGMTPLTLTLPPGMHEIHFKGSGISHKEVIQLFPDQVLRLNKTLTVSQKATVVWRLPYGSTVTINGRFFGRTPLASSRLKPGSYRLELYHPQYGYRKRSMRLSPGQRKVISFGRRNGGYNHGGGGI
ncbi:MAG: protein kinase [Myxococcales bacterium]|nr:protein kinase [Myxococcales bacterium]